MNKQIRLLIESLFDDIYDISLENNLDTEIGTYVLYKYFPKTKDKLQKIITQLLNERGKNADLNDIDVSLITDMSNLFKSLYPRNIDISLWDVSNVTNMFGMFYNCFDFTSDLSSWNVSNVTDMSWMFGNCTNFTGDLSLWDVSNVTNMSYMFFNCYNFNSDLNN